ncbi:DUF6993 domain-containing protein [Microbacterium tenebrionis]|uniref:DUF6993 domain-containing protein n=1 Tax=Microbacterium tenebrionis TaxID=2830665 RepID=UPI001D0D1265|nr:hypothetical protein [Microbacterium tenebrionis]
MTRRPALLRSRIAVVALLAGLSCGLVACTPSASPTRTVTTAPEATQVAPTATPDAPVLQPDGTAEENLPLFAEITADVWAHTASSSGRAYIDALVDAGFDKSAMQVTEDLTTVGNAAESIQFSVRWGDRQCLVGQVGPSTGEPVTMVMDQLAEGRCLVGRTRSIDW